MAYCLRKTKYREFNKELNNICTTSLEYLFSSSFIIKSNGKGFFAEHQEDEFNSTFKINLKLENYWLSILTMLRYINERKKLGKHSYLVIVLADKAKSDYNSVQNLLQAYDGINKKKHFIISYNKKTFDSDLHGTLNEIFKMEEKPQPRQKTIDDFL